MMNGINTCLLYTSDAADDLLCVDLGGRRIIKKKKLQSSVWYSKDEDKHKSQCNKDENMMT